MRGYIYYAKMPRHATKKHSCEKGYRPVVVVSSDIGCLTSPVIMCCPITTTRKQLSCNVDIGWYMHYNQLNSSQVLCNQITTIPRECLTECVGCVTYDELKQIDKAILISLGIRSESNDSGN